MQYIIEFINDASGNYRINQLYIIYGMILITDTTFRDLLNVVHYRDYALMSYSMQFTQS